MNTVTENQSIPATLVEPRKRPRRRPARNPAAASLIKLLAEPSNPASTAARAELLLFVTREEYLGIRSEFRLAMGDLRRRAKDHRRAAGQGVRLARYLRRSADAATVKGGQEMIASLDHLVYHLSYGPEGRSLRVQLERLQAVFQEIRQRARDLHAQRMAERAA